MIYVEDAFVAAVKRCEDVGCKFRIPCHHSNHQCPDLTLFISRLYRTPRSARLSSEPIRLPPVQPPNRQLRWLSRESDAVATSRRETLSGGLGPETSFLPDRRHRLGGRSREGGRWIVEAMGHRADESAGRRAAEVGCGFRRRFDWRQLGRTKYPRGAELPGFLPLLLSKGFKMLNGLFRFPLQPTLRRNTPICPLAQWAS